MFCRLGSVLESRPVAAISLVERRVDPAVGRDRLEQALDRLPQPGDVAVAEQVQQERVLGLDVERLQRIGVGGVAGLGALGLRHLELVEQHDLQLLGRAEVDLLADHRERLVGGLLDLDGEVALQRLEVVDVDRDAGLLHQSPAGRPAAARSRRAAGAPPCSSISVVERLGEVEHGPGVQHRRLRRRRRVVVEQHPLVVVDRLLLQLAAQVAQGEVGQVVGALVRAAPGRRPARCRSATPASVQPWAASASIGPLASWSTLGRGRVGEPARRAPASSAWLSASTST